MTPLALNDDEGLIGAVKAALGIETHADSFASVRAATLPPEVVRWSQARKNAQAEQAAWRSEQADAQVRLREALAEVNSARGDAERPLANRDPINAIRHRHDDLKAQLSAALHNTTTNEGDDPA